MDDSTSASTAYSTGQYETNYPPGFEHYYWARARNELICGAVRGLAPAGSAILDVGCGPGTTVDFLRSRGLDAWGVDTGSPRPMNERVAPYLETGRDASQVAAPLRARTRVALLLDVLEHIREPEPFLAAVLEALPACTRVVVTLPARQELWSSWDERYGHVRRYALEDLGRFETVGGLRLLQSRYFFHALYVPAFLYNLLGRERSVVVRSPTAAMRPLHRLVAGVLVAESSLLPHRVPGTSLLAVFERAA
jgi:SAM-dependent methyltransferase